jgi:hypothetical protein
MKPPKPTQDEAMLTDNEEITMQRQTMKSCWSLRGLVVIFTSACVGVLTAQAGDAPMTSMKMGSAQMEDGPATIDVSAYPKAGQDSYPLFTEKCAQCHHLNHTINSDHHALPDEWEAIVNRMWRKPGSNINKKQAEQIIEFLTYDSSVRKKAVVDEMLAMATPKEKKAAEDKIEEVHAKYGNSSQRPMMTGMKGMDEKSGDAQKEQK